MTFTYSEDLTIDRDFVRFHAGDTVSSEALLSDELIASLVATSGSKEKAVIQAIQYRIARLSDPNFRADWLQVDNRSAVMSLQLLLAQKRAELGVPRITGSITHVYRADSAAVGEPDYTTGRP
jgi:hypothetical protein